MKTPQLIPQPDMMPKTVRSSLDSSKILNIRRITLRTSRWNVLSTTALVCLLTPSLARADHNWKDSATGNWNTAGNWAENSVPNEDNVYINKGQTAFPIISSNPTNAINDLKIGQTSGRVDITGGTLSASYTAWTVVGDGGTGVFNLANTGSTGGVLTGFGQGTGTFNGSNYFWVGGSNFGGGGATGTLNVHTSGSLSTNNLFIGNQGSTGTVKIDSGTVTSYFKTVIGNGSQAPNQSSALTTGVGMMSVSGGTVNLNANFDGGGNLGIENKTAYIGFGNGSGTLTISGGNVNVGNASGGNIQFGGLPTDSSGTQTGGGGNINLEGGILKAGFIGAAAVSGVTANLNFDGGTLQSSINNGSFISSSVAVTIAGGGGTIDSQGFAIETGATITATGGGILTKTGTGALTLRGAGDNNALGATVTTGKLILAKTSSSAVHALGGGSNHQWRDGRIGW